MKLDFGQTEEPDQDRMTLYKLIVLYMLNRVKFPLTKAQIGDFFLGQEYSGFMTLQQVFAELIDADMVVAESMRNRTHLSLTDEGRKTLEFFQSRISPTTKDEIDRFFSENEMQLRNEVSILADYYKSTSGEYEAHLTARDKGINIVDITLSVPDEAIAAAICDNWPKRNQEIYRYLIEKLF